MLRTNTEQTLGKMQAMNECEDHVNTSVQLMGCDYSIKRHLSAYRDTMLSIDVYIFSN